MATTVLPAQVMQPLGELDCAFFPDNDLEQKVGGWLRQAATKVAADTTIIAASQQEAVSQWTYHLAYSYIAGRFAAMPNSVSVNKGADSVSYGQDRITYWQNRAAAAAATFNSLRSPTTPVDHRRSFPIPTVVGW